MNNKEAIFVLKKELDGIPSDIDKSALEKAIYLAIKALEERPTCMTCKYKGCYVTENPCKECSHAWVDKYEEAENE